MNAHDIEKIIARHILQEGSLDPFLEVPDDHSEATQNFLDMLVQKKRRRVMNDLRPLATAMPSEILKAFQTFGAYETTFYIQGIAGSHELVDIRPLYMAARKMGYPEESWDQVREHTEKVASFTLKNPQSEIYCGYESRMNSAIKAVLTGTQVPEELLYVDDRMYLNGILTSRVSAGQEYEDQTIAAGRLIGYALDQSDQCPDMMVEQKLRCAGLLALAFMNLPGADRYGDGLTKRPLQELLAKAHEKGATLLTQLDEAITEYSNDPQHVTYLREWQQRMVGATDTLSRLTARVAEKEAAGIELFIQPVQLAIRIYNHDLARKVATILKDDVSSIDYGAIPRQQKGPTPP